MWHAQVSSTINGAQLARFIKTGATPPAQFMEVDPADITAGKKADLVPNPEHDKWLTKDQQILSWLFGSLSKEVFTQVSSATTAAELYAAIQGLHASQSRARLMAMRMALSTASKGSSSMADTS